MLHGPSPSALTGIGKWSGMSHIGVLMAEPYSSSSGDIAAGTSNANSGGFTQPPS